ncbi:MAG: hypothetical protein HWD62_00380 [Cyclobacteriaceae bacterium]|nr:MAG: hypothetical protein HWD62_00380 [Cyclobacteriaceae bacterium]
MEGHFMNARLHGNNIGYFPDGTIRHKYQFKSGNKTGTNTDYYPNGKLKAKEQFAINGRDSKLSEYTSDEKLISEKSFREGKPHGTWVFYAADGKTLKLKENYEAGQLHGTRTLYHLHGVKATEETWRFNLITGLVKIIMKTVNFCRSACTAATGNTARTPNIIPPVKSWNRANT